MFGHWHNVDNKRAGVGQPVFRISHDRALRIVIPPTRGARSIWLISISYVRSPSLQEVTALTAISTADALSLRLRYGDTAPWLKYIFRGMSESSPLHHRPTRINRASSRQLPIHHSMLYIYRTVYEGNYPYPKSVILIPYPRRVRMYVS